MRFLSLLRDMAERAFGKKIVLFVFGGLFLVSLILGLAFISVPAVYDYHLAVVDRFVSRVCFSTRSVFVIFSERFFGNALLLLLLLLAGLHVGGLIITPAVLCFRGYIFGGSLYILFAVYRMTGALIVFVLYLPIHLLSDAVFLFAVTLSCRRAPCFRFHKEDFKELFFDFAVLLLAIAGICILEMILLLILFHPLGNII